MIEKSAPDLVAPWFQRRPAFATSTAIVLFVGVAAIRVWMPEEEAITALYVFPISLVAMARGMRAGLAAGVVALVLIVAGVLLTGSNLSVTGWLVRTATLLAVGALLGRAADNLARAERARRRHELAAQRHRQAVEINDTLIQGMAAAKWAIEAGQVEVGLTTLAETIQLGQDLVSDLIRENDLAWRTYTRDTAAREAALGSVPDVRGSAHS